MPKCQDWDSPSIDSILFGLLAASQRAGPLPWELSRAQHLFHPGLWILGLKLPFSASTQRSVQFLSWIVIASKGWSCSCPTPVEEGKYSVLQEREIEGCFYLKIFKSTTVTRHFWGWEHSINRDSPRFPGMECFPFLLVSHLPGPISSTGFIGSLSGWLFISEEKLPPLIFLSSNLKAFIRYLTSILKPGLLVVSLEIWGVLPQNHSKISAPMPRSLNTSFLYIQYIWSYIHLYTSLDR